MERSSSKMSSRIGLNARRSLWALLTIIHLPILVNVAKSLFFGSETGSWLAFISLILTIWIFILKFIDVRFLRFQARRSGALVFILACLFVHHEVIASEAAREVMQQAPMVLVLGAVAIGARAMRRQLRDLWRDMAGVFSRRLIVANQYGTVIIEPPCTTRWLICSLLTGPRAPPV